MFYYIKNLNCISLIPKPYLPFPPHAIDTWNLLLQHSLSSTVLYFRLFSIFVLLYSLFLVLSISGLLLIYTFSLFSLRSFLFCFNSFLYFSPLLSTRHNLLSSFLFSGLGYFNFILSFHFIFFLTHSYYDSSI